MHDTDVKTDHGIPVSSGMPPIVKISFFAGLIVIFAILALVAGTSAQNHVWPSEDSAKASLKAQ